MSTSEPQPPVASADLSETVAPGETGDGKLGRTHVMPEGAKTGDQSAKKPAAKSYTLGDFELRREIGRGGMGRVYLARQISLDRPCAVKVMSTELAQNPTFVERFIREARAMARLDHPNVVRCYAVGEERGKNYVAMELIDGKSMQDWLDELGRLSVPDALLVTLICADALQFAHSKNMIHRDIKPDNLLVTTEGVVKVADLGLAKATDEDMSMTQSGTGLGTPHYMPPEQARNAKHVDSRCDIYALGCTLYHFVTGELPYGGETVLELITSKEKGQFKPANRINSEVPERLDLIIDKMMAKDPKHRYASCAEVIKDLESLNLAAETLSFAGVGGVVARRSASPATVDMNAGRVTTATSPSRKPMKKRPGSGVQRTSGEGKALRKSGGGSAAGGKSGEWYVRHTDRTGKSKVSRMSTQQILQGMRSNSLDLKTRITRDPQDSFVPLAQFPVFEDEANRMVTRLQQQRRTDHIADAYKKIERQYDRQKWWRVLSRFRDGTLGFVGLIVWLVVVAVVAALAIWGMIQGWDFLGKWIEGLGS